MGISAIAITSLAVLLVEHCTSVTLARYTQQRVNAPNPAPAVAVLLAELLKLVMSVVLELHSVGGMGSASTPQRLFSSVCGSMLDTTRVAVPAFLYTVQNNLIYVALANLEVVAFQVLYQSKLLLTALLSFAFLGSRFTVQQWASLLLLTVGVVAVEMSGAKTASPRGARRHHLGVGATAAFASALLSSCAGVYFEAVVKKQEANAPSLWVRNVQLCVFSVPLSAVAVAYQWRRIQNAGGPLSGFDGYTNALVLLNAAGGLVVAVVVKYGDNVLKNFTTSCSVILGTLISVFLFDFQLTLQARCLPPSHSHHLYHLTTPPSPPPAPPPPAPPYLHPSIHHHPNTHLRTCQFVWGAALVMLSAYMYGTLIDSPRLPTWARFPCLPMHSPPTHPVPAPHLSRPRPSGGQGEPRGQRGAASSRQVPR